MPSGSEDGSLEEITAAVYSELRRLAGGYLNRDSGSQTLQPTALVHEVYMRMAAQDSLRWRNRGHFFRNRRPMRGGLIRESCCASVPSPRSGFWSSTTRCNP